MSDVTDRARSEPAPAPRLGEILLRDGVVSDLVIRKALALQQSSGAPVGEILSARGWAAPDAVTRALARQQAQRVAPLASQPPDKSLLRAADVPLYLSARALPWRLAGDGSTVHISDDPRRAERALPDAAGRIQRIGREAMNAALAEALRHIAPERPSQRVAARDSVRSGAPLWQKACLLGGLALFSWTAFVDLGAALAALFLGLALINILTATIRGLALAATLFSSKRTGTGAQTAFSAHRKQPRIALMIALLDEDESLPVLFRALEAIDWPRELLEVMLLVETHDVKTQEAIRRHAPPAFMRAVLVPDGAPRTKPRALNFALDLTDADIIGIYDAEDAPPPINCARWRRCFWSKGRIWRRCSAA